MSNTIKDGLPSPISYAPSSNEQDAGALRAAANSQAIAQQLHTLAVEMAGKTFSSNSSSDTAANELDNGTGAPNIDGVVMNFSADDMIAILQQIRSKTQEVQLRSAEKGLDCSRVKQEKANERALAKIHEWVKKSESAAAKQKVLSIFGWIGKVLGFIACAVATVAAAVATGGAAAPLLAVAVVGLVASGISLASSISQAAGGPSLEISSLMTKACFAILEACGVPEEKREAASKVMAGSIAVLLCPVAVAVDPALLGNLAGGISNFATTDTSVTAGVTAGFTVLASIAAAAAVAVMTLGASATKDVATIPNLLQKALRFGETGTALLGSANTATSGGLGVAIAVDEHRGDIALAEKKQFDAIVLKLQAQMENDREDYKKLIEQIQDGAAVVMQMLNSAADSRSQISKNIGKGMA